MVDEVSVGAKQMAVISLVQSREAGISSSESLRLHVDNDAPPTSPLNSGY
jgi:hypothetical protein